MSDRSLRSYFFFQAEDGIRDDLVTGVQTCALPICDNNVSILLGNGEGTFRPPTTFAAGIVPVFVVVGDFNGDGKPDLGVANSAYCCTCPNPRVCGRVPGGVSVLLGNGAGTFRAAQSVVAGGSPGSLAVGDFNRDGVLDLAVSDQYQSNNVSILLGNGDGTFRVAGET